MNTCTRTKYSVNPSPEQFRKVAEPLFLCVAKQSLDFYEYAIKCYKYMGRGAVLLIFQSFKSLVQGDRMDVCYFNRDFCESIQFHNLLSLIDSYDLETEFVCAISYHHSNTRDESGEYYGKTLSFASFMELFSLNQVNAPVHTTTFWKERTNHLLTEVSKHPDKYRTMDSCYLKRWIFEPYMPSLACLPHDFPYSNIHMVRPCIVWKRMHHVSRIDRSEWKTRVRQIRNRFREATNFVCAQCKQTKKYKELKRCSRCKSIYYCSKECQTKDWHVHKHSCLVKQTLVE